MKKLVLVILLLMSTASFAQWIGTSSYYDGDIYGLSSSPGTVCMLTGTGVSQLKISDTKWNPLQPFSNLSSISLLAGNDSVIVVYNSDYSISHDGGATWTVRTGPSSISYLGVMGQVIVVINSSATLSYTLDYGVTWHESPGGLNPDDYTRPVTIMDNEVYAFQDTYPAEKLFKCSFDGVSFTSWTVVKTFASSEWHDSMIASESVLYIGGSSGVKKSVNKGQTWTLLGYNGGYTITEMATDSAYLYANLSYKIVRYSFTTGIWTTILSYSMEDTIPQMIIACNGHFYAYLSSWETSFGLYEYIGSKWKKIDALPIGSETGGISCVRSSDNVLFASVSGQSGGMVFTSSNDGKTWLSCESADSWSAKDAFHSGYNFLIAGYLGVGIVDTATNSISQTSGIIGYEAYSFEKFGNILYAGTADGIYSSTNDGVSWTYKYLKGKKVYKLEVCMDTLYAGTDQGLFYAPNGTSWGSTNCVIPDIRDVAATKQDIFVASASGLLKKDNVTKTWMPVGTTLIGVDVNEIISQGNRLYVATAHGTVLYTDDGGNTWMDISDAGFTNVTGLDFSGPNLFISEWSSGVWKNPVGWPNSIDPGKDKSSLSVFPVPVKDRLTIRAPDNFMDMSIIELINSSGILVKSINVTDAFMGTVMINVTDLPAGFYLARLRNREQTVCSRFSKVN